MHSLPRLQQMAYTSYPNIICSSGHQTGVKGHISTLTMDHPHDAITHYLFISHKLLVYSQHGASLGWYPISHPPVPKPTPKPCLPRPCPGPSFQPSKAKGSPLRHFAQLMDNRINKLQCVCRLMTNLISAFS